MTATYFSNIYEDSLKQIKSPIHNFKLYSVILISLFIGSTSFASTNNPNINDGPLFAYKKFNCEGDRKLFASGRELRKHVLRHATYYSYHAEDDEELCVNFVEIDYRGVVSVRLNCS